MKDAVIVSGAIALGIEIPWLVIELKQAADRWAVEGVGKAAAGVRVGLVRGIDWLTPTPSESPIRTMENGIPSASTPTPRSDR